jgi:hypothetical protein
MVVETLIKGKPLKEVVAPRDYDRVKHRRLRVIGLLKEHLSK